MRIIARKALREFWQKHPSSKGALEAWYADTNKAKWLSPADIRNVYRNASFLANNRVIFDIKGNHYRIVAAINYAFGIVYIRFVGTHKEYDCIDAAKI